MKRWVFLVIVPLAVLIAVFFMRYVSLETQQSLTFSLLFVTSILFAIFSIWVSVLDPTVILEPITDLQLSPRQRLAFELLAPLKQTTYILVAAILLRLAVPIIIALLGQNNGAVWQIVIGSLIVFLYLWQAVIVLITIRFSDALQRAFQAARSRHRARDESTRKTG